MEKVIQSHHRRIQVIEAGDVCFEEDSNDKCASTQLLRMQKKQLIDLQEFFLERYCNVLPVFGFNNAKYDMNLIKFYFLSKLLNGRDFETVVLIKAKKYLSFKIGNIQLLDIMNFLGRATTLGSFLKAYEASETSRFFIYEWFHHFDKMQSTEVHPYGAFYSNLRDCDLIEAEYVNLFGFGMTTEQAVGKLKSSRAALTRVEKYFYLQKRWKQEHMSSFKDFLPQYNNKDVVPKIEAYQKKISFLPQKKTLTC